MLQGKIIIVEKVQVVGHPGKTKYGKQCTIYDSDCVPNNVLRVNNITAGEWFLMHYTLKLVIFLKQVKVMNNIKTGNSLNKAFFYS